MDNWQDSLYKERMATAEANYQAGIYKERAGEVCRAAGITNLDALGPLLEMIHLMEGDCRSCLLGAAAAALYDEATQS